MNRKEIIETVEDQVAQDLNTARMNFEVFLGKSINPTLWNELGIEIVPPSEIQIYSVELRSLTLLFQARLSSTGGIFQVHILPNSVLSWMYSLNDQKIPIEEKCLLKFVCFEIQRVEKEQKSE